jgi:integrase
VEASNHGFRLQNHGRAKYTILYTDEHGKRRKKIAYADKRESERLGIKLEERAAKIKNGDIDPRDEAYRDHSARPLSEHLADWTKALEAKGTTPKHVELFTCRAKRIVALLAGAKLREIDSPKNAKRADLSGFELALSKWTGTVRLSDLSTEAVQKALSTLKAEGLSLATCNHYRTAIQGFANWCFDTHRTRDNHLRGVSGFNAKEDRRQDRRTISLEELQRLVSVADRGPTFMGISGPARALSYRLAVATGLRCSELSSVTPESFDWQAPRVVVAAAYTKNGDPATFPLSSDLANDLAAYVAPLPPGKPIFPLPIDKGAPMLRRDLEAAKIPYRDAGGLVFDFHSLRCEMATLADAAGISPRVVQKMMLHSTLELTGRYTKPRAVDIEAATGKLPSLRPDTDRPESVAMTGTDPGPVLRDATQNATAETTDRRKSNTGDGTRTHDLRILSPARLPSVWYWADTGLT